jgi:hypothetical protein
MAPVMWRNLRRRALQFTLGDRQLPLLIWSLSFIVFLLSPVVQFGDSAFSLLLSESLLYRRTFDLSLYLPESAKTVVVHNADYLHVKPLYQLVHVKHAIVYAYPLGGSILAIPFVAVFNLCGISVSRNQHFNLLAEVAIQRFMAAFLMATLAWIFFRTARLLLPRRWSAIIALGAVFGTPIWSSLSRGLWGQTWAVFLTGYLVYRLLEDDTNVRPVNGAMLATLASWIFFARPTGAIVVLVVTAYLLAARKQLLRQWFIAGLFWLACFVALSWSVYGTPVPPYYLHGGLLTTAHMFAGTAGVLFSPSRGLLIFVPATVWVLWLVLTNFDALPHRSLAWIAMAICLVQVPLAGCDAKWWGGHSYGPRLMADIIPWLVLLAILACAAELHRRVAAGTPNSVRNHHARIVPRQSLFPHPADEQIRGMRRALKLLGAAALAISVLMNAPGALSFTGDLWNKRGGDVDTHPERLWDLERPQFLAWALLDGDKKP